MTSLKRKILYALIIVDVLIGIGTVTLPNGGLQTLNGWLSLNAFVIIPAVGIKVALWQRKKKRAQGFSGISEKQTPSYRQEKSYAIPRTTQNGEVVKSGGEKMIADYFHNNDIQYEYEKSAIEISTNRRISRPDFCLPDYNVYVEYWGMVNTEESHKRQEYIRGMEWKMAKYHENGIKFISIYPEDLGKLDSVLRKKLKEITDRT